MNLFRCLGGLGRPILVVVGSISGLCLSLILPMRLGVLQNRDGIHRSNGAVAGFFDRWPVRPDFIDQKRSGGDARALCSGAFGSLCA